MVDTIYQLDDIYDELSIVFDYLDKKYKGSNEEIINVMDSIGKARFEISQAVVDIKKIIQK